MLAVRAPSTRGGALARFGFLRSVFSGWHGSCPHNSIAAAMPARKNAQQKIKRDNAPPRVMGAEDSLPPTPPKMPTSLFFNRHVIF